MGFTPLQEKAFGQSFEEWRGVEPKFDEFAWHDATMKAKVIKKKES